jgi:hypothetical protein
MSNGHIVAVRRHIWIGPYLVQGADREDKHVKSQPQELAEAAVADDLDLNGQRGIDIVVRVAKVQVVRCVVLPENLRARSTIGRWHWRWLVYPKKNDHADVRIWGPGKFRHLPIESRALANMPKRIACHLPRNIPGMTMLCTETKKGGNGGAVNANLKAACSSCHLIGS